MSTRMQNNHLLCNVTELLRKHHMLENVIFHDRVITMEDVYTQIPNCDPEKMMKTLLIKIRKNNDKNQFILCGIPANKKYV